VTWTNLLANKEAQKHKTSKNELDNFEKPKRPPSSITDDDGPSGVLD
jgi:hypothetical protein